MNAEQKRRAERILSEWHDGKYSATRHGVDMASLLHELVDAAEEFESLTRNEDGTVTLKPGFKAVACTAQEALPATNPAQISSSAESVMCPGCEGAPANPNNPCAVCGKKAPSPSVPDELSGRFTDPVKLAYVDGWNACREAMLAATPTSADLDGPEFSDGCEKEGFPGGCERMGCCKPTPPEPPAELPTWENGDAPLVGGGLISRGVVDFATVGIWPTEPAPSVPDVAQTIPSHDQITQILNGLDRCAAAESKREFLRIWIRDWTAHKLAAPTPAEAPADVARDAERYRACNGYNCGCTDGISHSDECVSEHDAIVNEAALVDHVEHGGWKCFGCGYDGQDNQRYNRICARCGVHR